MALIRSHAAILDEEAIDARCGIVLNQIFFQ